MFELNSLGRWLIFAGLGIAALGGLLLLLGKIPFFGRLPGDINYTGPQGRILNVVIRLINR
jgi:ABC-type transporter Mla subunit MlaD